jgi:16S rRNA G1207 methylase RsmC
VAAGNCLSARRLPQLAPGMSGQALDCGLGTGVLAMAFACVVPAVTIVYGIDVSPAVLHHAAANLAEPALHRAGPGVRRGATSSYVAMPGPTDEATAAGGRALCRLRFARVG